MFEPYELHEQVAGRLTLRTQTGLVRIALHGRGIDTIPPTVSVETHITVVAVDRAGNRGAATSQAFAIH